MKTLAWLKDQDSLTLIVRRCLLTAGCLSLIWTVGCGAPSSDKVPGQESRAAVAGSNLSAPLQDLNQGTNRAGLLSDMSQAANTAGVNQQDRLAGKDDANNQPQSANLPASIAKDLASPDARTRYRALDH